MDELKNKIENDESVNEETDFDEFENVLIENDNSENIQIYENELSRFNVYFYFQIKDKEFVFPFVSDTFNIYEDNVNNLIKNIVKKINEKKIIVNCDNINYIVSLKDIEDIEDENDETFYCKNYELKACKKKNFKPKEDSPSFSSKSILKNIDNKKISFVSKNPLNIMIREKFETNKEEGENKYQFLFDED